MNKMPLTNLVRVLGPTVVGYSSASTTDLAQAEEETRKQATVGGHSFALIRRIIYEN